MLNLFLLVTERKSTLIKNISQDLIEVMMTLILVTTYLKLEIELYSKLQALQFVISLTMIIEKLIYLY